MYESFFQLRKLPFGPVADLETAEITAQQKEVIRSLALGVRDRKGYMALTAEPGLGKTTVLRALTRLLIESGFTVVTVLTPTLSASEFLEMVMMNLGIADVPSSKARRLKTLEEILIRSDASGRPVVLIVDEAHKLSEELLEEIRLLGNFEGADHKLLQIILAGQEELSTVLNQPAMWQLKQRIARRLTLQRFDRRMVEEYARNRWTEAGGSSFPFSADALDALAAWSLGNPRLINNICDHALVITFSETTREVHRETIREACEELTLATPQPMEPRIPAQPLPSRPAQKQSKHSMISLFPLNDPPN